MQLTAVEEELNAIKTKLSSVRITGAMRFREDLNQFNPNLGGLPGGPFPTTKREPQYQFGLRLDDVQGQPAA